MKITVKCDRLSKECRVVGAAIPKKPEPEILSHITIEKASDTTVVLTSFNGTLQISSELECQVEDSGFYLIPYKALAEVLQLLDSELELVLEFEEKSCIIEAPGTCLRLSCSALDYPTLPVQEPDCVEYTFNTDDFASAVGFNGNFVEKTKLDNILASIFFECRGEGDLTVFSTDSHQLGRAVVEDINLKEAFKFNLPGSFLVDQKQVLEGVVPKMKYLAPTLTLSCDRHHRYSIAIAGRRIISNSMSQAYPNCHKLIPESFSGQFSVARKELIRSLRLAMRLGNDFNKVFFQINEVNNILTIKSEGDKGGATQTLETTGAYSCCDLLFNCKYLIKGVLALEGDTLIVKMNAFNLLVAIVSPDNLGHTYYVMPMNPN